MGPRNGSVDAAVYDVGAHTSPVVILETDSPPIADWGNVALGRWPARAAATYGRPMASHEETQGWRRAAQEGGEGPGGGPGDEGADAEGTVADTESGPGGGAASRQKPPPPPPAGGVVSWRDTGAVWWSDWQLPVFVVLFTVAGVLAVTFVVLLWLKHQMVSGGKRPPGDPALCQAPSTPPPLGLPPRTEPPPQQWIVHPVMRPPLETLDAANIQPQLGSVLPEVMTRRCANGDEPLQAEPVRIRAEPVRIRAKGLLERRGSSASLTIELLPSAHDAAPAGGLVTPTRECASEEYLLSAGNVLSRSELRLCLRDVRPLHREFWDLPSNHPEGSAAVAGCGTKNRYRTILPNERSRVRLRCHQGDRQAEYINANYVRGYDGEARAYIATQGPLPHTVGDFWSLVWQEEVSAVVMITRLCEQGRPKCERYLPDEGPGAAETFGPVEVTLVSVEPREHCTLRRLAIRRRDGDETRELSHFWFDSWPDHKTPAGPRDLVALAREVEELRRVGRTCEGRHGGGGPVLVHCSAGIGRTGCFIAVSVGIRQLLEEDNVDILGIVCQMRYDRGGMIQTAEQYEFVHRALCLFEQSLPASE